MSPPSVASTYSPPVSPERAVRISSPRVCGLPMPIVKIGTLMSFAALITPFWPMSESESRPSETRMTAFGPGGSVAELNCCTPRTVASRMFEPSPG